MRLPQKPGPRLTYADNDTVSVTICGGLVRILFGKTMAEVSPDLAEAFGLRIVEAARKAELGAKWRKLDRN